MDFREGYLNVDFSTMGSDGSTINPDIIHDVRERLPWEDDSVDEVIFRESLEHFNREDGYEVLKEIYRILKPGGTLDLTVPNAPMQLIALCLCVNESVTIEQWLDPHEPPWGWPKYHEDLMGATHRTLFKGKDMGQGDSHKTLYNAKTLSTVLQSIGFVLVSSKIESSFYIMARKIRRMR